jgi:hypothetical protein
VENPAANQSQEAARKSLRILILRNVARAISRYHVITNTLQ